MKKVLILLAAGLLLVQPAPAQNVLNRLKQRAKNAVENNIGNKVERGINDVLNGNVGTNNTSNDNGDRQSGERSRNRATQSSQTEPKAPAGDAGSGAQVSRPASGDSRELPGGVPNPYTTFDTPENPFDVGLGLPKNDEGDKPAQMRARERVSYAAYTYPAVGNRGKEFWNAERKRMYSISFGMWNGKPQVSKFLAVLDSLAIYQINDEAKTITKFPLSAVQEVASHNVISNTQIYKAVDISSSQGRWCHMSSGAHETTYDIAGHEASEVNGETSYTDLETGIVIEVTHGFDHDYTRNIHVGLFYPEIYDLPEGYRMITVDFKDQMRQMDEMEERWKNAEEQMKNLDLENKSLEELMKML